MVSRGRVILADRPDISDARSHWWREQFEKADSYETYISRSDPEQADRWRDFERTLPPLEQRQKARLTAVRRDMNVLVSAGIWCGDCVRQVPMLQRTAEACGANVRLRVIDRDASNSLRQELRILGGMRIPVAVFLSEDFFEIGRFGDRLLSGYRLKAQREAGEDAAGLVPAAGEELKAEMADWVDVFERMLLMLRTSSLLRQRYGD